MLASCVQVKFNQALADHSMSDKPRLIDGIVLTKFDTIDDKVNKVPNDIPPFDSGMFWWSSLPVWGTHRCLLCCAFVTNMPSSLSLSLSPGRRCHFHDLHHGPAHRVCGHRADLQWPAQLQRTRCGQRPDEGLRGCMNGRILVVFLFCFFHHIDKYTPTTYAWTARRLLLPWPSPAVLINSQHTTRHELHSHEAFLLQQPG